LETKKVVEVVMAIVLLALNEEGYSGFLAVI